MAALSPAYPYRSLRLSSTTTRTIFAIVTVVLGAATVFISTGHEPATVATRGCAPSEARYDVTLPGHPFSAQQSPDGKTVFVSLVSSSPKSPNGLAVLHCDGARYRYSHTVLLESQPTGMAISHDGKTLVVADDGFIAFVDAVAAARKQKPALLGYMQDLEGSPEDNDPGSTYANFSPDDRYAFVSEEQNATITVIDIAKARASHFSRSSIVGEIPVGEAPVALTFSNDGRYLFTTSEIARREDGYPKECKMGGARAAPSVERGAIYTVDVAKAETDPAHSVISKTLAGCSPVRLAIAPDGSVVWVTNRSSNDVRAFSTAKLIAGAPDALVQTVAVGANPVPVAVTRDGRYVLAGNSNRFGANASTPQTVSVVATDHGKAIGSIAVGVFPREFQHGSGTTLFLANYGSSTLTVFNTARLMELVH
jgi:DNA-binding beta-propeller fold protein YncE